MNGIDSYAFSRLSKQMNTAHLDPVFFFLVLRLCRSRLSMRLCPGCFFDIIYFWYDRQTRSSTWTTYIS